MEYEKLARTFKLSAILIGLSAYTFPGISTFREEIPNTILDSAELITLDAKVKKLAFKYPDSSLSLGQVGLTQSIRSNDSALASSFWLNMGAAFYAKGAFDSALHFYGQSVVFSEGTQDKFTMPLAMNNMAVIFQRIGQVDTAIHIYKNVYKMYQDRKDTARQGRCLFNLGRAHLIIGEEVVGLRYIEQSIEIYKQLGARSFKNLANAYNEIATIKYNDGEYLLAMDDYQKSIRYYEEAGDTLKALMPKGNIGNIHMDLKDYEGAVEVFEEIIEIKNEHNLYTVHFNYHNLGNAYDKLGVDSLAIKNLHKALELRQKAGALGHSTSTAVKLGDFYKRRNKVDSAGYYYAKAYDLSRTVDNSKYQLQALCAYGEWKLREGKWREARGLLSRAFQTAEILNYRPLLARASKGLQEVYAQTGDYSKAYKYLQIASNLEDTLFNAELVRETAVLESGFRYEKELLQKKNEIQELESKEELANLRITLLVVGIILIALIAFFVIWSQIRKKRQIQLINRFKEAMTGMIAHDLKNPLSIILNNRDVEKNQHTARQMLQLINNMLDVQKFEAARMPLNLKTIDLNSLVKSAKKQVEILAKQSNVKIVVDAQSLWIKADQEILERVLVNLLTNAIKYAPLNSEVKVSAIEKGGLAVLSVMDKGKGIAKEDQELIFESFGQSDPRKSGGVGSTGLGLTFCRLATEAHGSQLNLVSESGQGTTFSFSLNLFPKGEPEDMQVSEPQLFLTMTADEQQVIAACIPKLKALHLYQISEIEKELEVLKVNPQEAISDWMDALLDAAYAGNNQRYEELIEEAERVS